MFGIEKEKEERIKGLVEKLIQMDNEGIALINRDANTLLTYQNIKKNETEKKVG